MKMKVNGNSKNNITGNAKRNRSMLIFILLAYVLNVGFLITGTQIQLPLYKQKLRSLEAGQVADFQVKAENEVFYIDDEKTEEIKEQQASTILPVYTIEETKVLNLISHFERFASFYMQEGRDLPPQELIEELSMRFPNRFGTQDIEILADAEELGETLPVIEEELRRLLENGIFPSDVKTAQNGRGVLQLWHWKGDEKLHEKYTQKNIITENEIKSVAQQKLASFNFEGETKAAAVMLLSNFAEQTAYYNATLTTALKNQARQQIQPITYHIQKGELLISEGDIVSHEDMRKVEALLEKRPKPDVQESIAIILYMAGIFFLAIIMYKPLLQRSRRFYQHTNILLIASFIFTLNIFLVLTFTLIPPGIPVSIGIFTALISMLIATLIGQRIGIISSLLLSLIFFAIPDIDIYTFIFSFLAGITATYLIRSAEKRIDLVAGTLKLALVVALITVIIGLFQQQDAGWFLKAGGFGIIHAFITGALNLALLPAFEHLLNAPTVFRLRELSDTNTPLFKRMMTIAGGTYSHSMGVANLAESACREIGANHLLARVGAYYHDIGKMDQPDYFIENQQDKNRHDEITPNLSVAVIKSHVKIGKERAKELKLPPEVVEIVSDHHGSDVISYFYQQALKKGGKAVPEEFSYNGTPPRSKESAVVMLADTIEAQSRTIKKPSVQKFEKMVWDAIMHKVSRKQMSNTELSFRDIEIIKTSFVQILAGQFHSRIEYPDQKS
ncbi:MAG: HDIG domain-containing protein [Spirochaetia bacterium]|nr:HDIG domain-containing protein [Spirochaetia bacterium]